MVAVRPTKRPKHLLARHVLKGGRGVDQTSIEKHPTSYRTRPLPVGKGHFNGSTRKRGSIYPGERQPVAFQFFLDDPTTRLRHDRVPASIEFGEQCRLAAA
jgi:hypothetical protein